MSELESLFNKADEQKAPNVFKKMFYLRFLGTLRKFLEWLSGRVPQGQSNCFCVQK